MVSPRAPGPNVVYPVAQLRRPRRCRHYLNLRLSRLHIVKIAEYVDRTRHQQVVADPLHVLHQRRFIDVRKTPFLELVSRSNNEHHVTTWGLHSGSKQRPSARDEFEITARPHRSAAVRSASAHRPHPHAKPLPSHYPWKKESPPGPR